MDIQSNARTTTSIAKGGFSINCHVTSRDADVRRQKNISSVKERLL